MVQSPEAVYLHIGHGKTGSSFLQSALALSQPALAKHGIIYPIEADAAEAAGKGHISGGNLRAKAGALTGIVRKTQMQPGQRLLISSESFFQYLVRHADAFADEYRAVCGDAPLHVLCYLRDPVDHAISVYQQKVKRGGYTGTLAESLDSYEILARTVAVLGALRDMGAQVTVLNYSRHRAGLTATLADWLGVSETDLTLPETGQVNRSLTMAELELQRLMNIQLGGAARRFVSDPLCNLAPEMRSETPPLDRAALETFLNRVAAQIEGPEYQALVPADERPKTGSVADHIHRFPASAPAAEDRVFQFTGRQLEILAQALSAPLARQQQVRRKRAAQKGSDGQGSPA